MATVPTRWQKSSFSEANGNCVEVAASDGVIIMRESDQPEEMVITSRVGLRALLQAVKAGRYDHLA